jgi:aminoglycoside phosphotransferase (APT) family kinase protein
MRPDAPDLATVHAVATSLLGHDASLSIEGVAEGVSTFVYRLRRRADTLYLRVLPEADATFAPEVWALVRLRERGARVPAVVAHAPRDERLQRAVMIVAAVPGAPLAPDHGPEVARRVLRAAGRDLALLQTVPVEGFGWVRRDRDRVTGLTGEHPTLHAFAWEHLAADLAALDGPALTDREVARVWSIIDAHPAWLAEGRACLAHGDLDLSHIFQQGGYYSGLIDFGEMRGADRWYDLGHFCLHDGERVPWLGLEWLVEGYGAVVPLSPDYRQRISFASLLIAVPALARHLQRGRPALHRHPGLPAIRRALARLAP